MTTPVEGTPSGEIVEESPAVDLLVNGRAMRVAEDSTVASLLAALGLAAHPCAVELNRRVIPRRDHGATRLGSGDRVEIVTLVGGG